MDVYPFFKCLIFACFPLSVASNFSTRSARQENQIEGPYRAVLAIKMRGPDSWQQTVEGYVERQNKKRQILFLEDFFFFFTKSTACITTTLDEESLIVTSDGFKWVNSVFACIKYKAYELGENLGPSKSIFCP